MEEFIRPAIITKQYTLTTPPLPPSSTFDRLLDAKLREEELTIPVLRPTADKYKFAEEDSEENIIFDEESKVHTGPGTLVKAGTIYKLVERLTYHEYAGACVGGTSSPR